MGDKQTVMVWSAGSFTGPSHVLEEGVGLYFRWTESNSPDIPQYQQKNLVYTFRGAPSRKAFWVFEMGSPYRPSASIMRDRILLAFTFGPDSDNTIHNSYNWVRFPSPAFVGETKHPLNIIVKDNEPGSFGIGTKVRESLTVLDIRCATRSEIARALGISPRNVGSVPSW